MTPGLAGFLENFRQLRYPRPFQIRRESAAGLARAVMEALAAPAAAAPAEDTVGVDALVQIANQCFRIQRSVNAMDAAETSTKETRGIGRSVKTVRTLLEDNGILLLDPTGEPFEDGRLDFEIAGDPDVSAEVTRPTITFCERPIIIHRGRVVQRGKGIVSIPDRTISPQ